MNEKLISDDTLKAYRDRFQKMQEHKNTEKGDELFISRLVAISEQIDNMHVKAKIGDFEIENDGPKELVGTTNMPSPIPMFLATYANCLEITALLYLSFSNVKVNSIKVKIEATLDKRSALDPINEPFPGLYDIKYTWYVDTEESLKKIDLILKKAEEICPVKGTFNKHHEFPREIHFVSEK